MSKNERIIAELRSLIIHVDMVDGLPPKTNKKMDIKGILALSPKVSQNLDHANKITGAY